MPFLRYGFKTETKAIRKHGLLGGVKPTEGEPAYLTFQSVSPFSISTTPHWDGIMEYSTDTVSWAIWNGSSVSSVNGKLYFRGTNNTRVSSTSTGSYSAWTITGSSVECVGNIEYLLDYATVARGQHPTMATHCYEYIFRNDVALTVAPMLPAIILSEFCYRGMFCNCTSLTVSPSLPATTLANSCYGNMFQGDTALVIVPALLATTLITNCYNFMFYGCSAFKVSSIKTGAYQHAWRIPVSGTGTEAGATNWNYYTLSSTGGTFTSTPQVNTTYYIENKPV
jgi:hypothetical protein